MISLVIPAFNEEKRLGKSLELLSDFLKSRSEEFEVIVADDGSTDNTQAVAGQYSKEFKNFKITTLPVNKGKGAAVNAGFKEASGDTVVFTDADFSTPITEIDKLLSKIDQGFDIAIGSRAVDQTLVKKHQNWVREMMGKFFNFLVQQVAVPGVKDTQCGFKAFNRSTTEKIFEKQVIFGFGFDVELLYLARKLSLRVAEVPVLWFNDEASKVNPIKDSIVTLYELFKIRFTHSKEKVSWLDKLINQLYRRRTFAKFVMVGLSATFVDFFGYLALTRLFDLKPLTANPISVESAIIWSFSLNNLWTFAKAGHQKSLFSRFITYQFVTFGSLLFSQIQIFIYLHVLGIPDLVAKLITLPTVAIFNYSIHKRWTFRAASAGKAPVIPFIILIFSLLLLYLILTTQFDA